MLERSSEIHPRMKYVAIANYWVFYGVWTKNPRLFSRFYTVGMDFSTKPSPRTYGIRSITMHLMA